MTIDLRSDTVTRPCLGMKSAMMDAPLGDDVFGEDPMVNKLETFSANLFGKEAGIFCPSGTMTNQIAVKVHTVPLDEIILDKLSHVYNYEVGGYAYHSSVSARILNGDRGRITPEQVENAIQGDFDWYPNSSLVIAENTCNKGGGSYYSLKQLSALSACCKKNNLQFHLDGARVFNAIVESGIDPLEMGKLFDSISICLSKGLGAPIGSVLIGDAHLIKKARKVRKVMGGGMRQAGIIAAAGLYALENNRQKLAEDHRRAKELALVLENCAYVKQLLPVDTNILIFELVDALAGDHFIQQLAEQDIKAVEFAKQTIRFVTHLDFTDEMLDKTIEVLKKIQVSKII